MATQAPTTAPSPFLRRLRREMARQPVSLREVARRVGVSAAYLSRLLNEERGLPADETIARLEDVLDIQPRGALFDAAGRADKVARSFLKREKARPLMRTLAPLTDKELEEVLEVAEKLARRHSTSSR